MVEVIKKPKQNNFMQMVEMQKKQEKHHKLKASGKHGNHKLIPAQVAQDIAKGQPNTRATNLPFYDQQRKSQYSAVGRNSSLVNEIDCQLQNRNQQRSTCELADRGRLNSFSNEPATEYMSRRTGVQSATQIAQKDEFM